MWNELFSSKPVIADGGWGTRFTKMGLLLGIPPEIWNLEKPDCVFSVADSYVKAGSQIILTNTFGGTSYKLKKSGAHYKASILNKLGVEISKKAAGKRSLVFADIGPIGDMLEPYGDLKPEFVRDEFLYQVESLIDAKPDGFVIETMISLEEALLALKAVRYFTLDLPVVVSFTFQKVADGFATMMGVRPENVIKILEDEGASAVGANCGSGIREIVEVTKLFSKVSSVPIWVKPNAGLPKLVNGNLVYEETPDMMASFLPDLVKAGASIVGGCCGTDSEHIKAFIKVRERLLNE